MSLFLILKDFTGFKITGFTYVTGIEQIKDSRTKVVIEHRSISDTDVTIVLSAYSSNLISLNGSNSIKINELSSISGYKVVKTEHFKLNNVWLRRLQLQKTNN